MDWAFNKVEKSLVPEELVPEGLRELLYLTSRYGYESADCNRWGIRTMPEEEIARLSASYDGIAFRLREIFYDKAHGLGPLAEM